MIDPEHPRLSIERQCELLGLSRSAYYYEPVGEDELNQILMRRLDEQYTRTPFYGIRKMTEQLRLLGYAVNPKRVARLMRVLGLEALYPKPRTSPAHPEHRKWPYLLRSLVINRPNQVWCADVTYIRLGSGFVYLVAVMDWFSRYVLSWRLSNTLDAGFCVEALEEALGRGRPEIFNTDQGVQFTSREHTGLLEASGVRISMDGRGRCFDNIFVERLWRSLKYEEVYLKEYQGVPEARSGLGTYFRFYNEERLHQGLGYRTPRQVYCEAGPGRAGERAAAQAVLATVALN